MSAVQFATGDGQTVKLWSDRLLEDITTDGGIVTDLLSAGVIHKEESLSKEAGDYVKTHFLERASNAGFLGDASPTGLEQGLSHDPDSIYINEVRNVWKIPTKGHISAQRVKFNLPENVYQVARNWTTERITVSALNQLAGNAATSIIYDGVTYTGTTGAAPLALITGMNTITEASSSQIIRANSQSTDNAVGSDTTATFHLGYIIQAENAARKNRPYIVPIAGKTKYRCIIHTDAYQQLVQDTTFAIQFRDIYLNMIASGKGGTSIDNQSFVFSQTEIIVTDKIPNGQTSGTANTNTRRAVFCGQEAATMALGQGYTYGGKTTAGFSFDEDFQEGRKWQRIFVTGIYGIKKAIYNSKDRGTIVIVHYTA